MSDNGLFKDSNLFSLNKSTYVNLRWIAYIGQIITILIVQFILEYNFNYLICISIVFLSVLTNINLQFKIQENQLNNQDTNSFYREIKANAGGVGHKRSRRVTTSGVRGTDNLGRRPACDPDGSGSAPLSSR